jgi:hypothetical protein
MKKLLIIGIVAVVAMASLAVGYAMWSKTLYINGTVNTGSVDAKWSPVVFQGDSEPTAKDVSRIACTIDPADDTKLSVLVTGAYPSIWYACTFDITSEGTVPVHTVLEWQTPPPAGWDFVLTEGPIVLPVAPAQVYPIPPAINWSTVQLHQGDSKIVTLLLHFGNEDNVQQGGTYTFAGTILAKQWNE